MTMVIKEALEQVLGSYDDWRFKLLKSWSVCIGPLHAHVRLERIYNDVLVLGVYDIHWMQELYMLSRTILASINQLLGAQHITELKFKIVERPRRRSSLTTGLLDARGSRKRELTDREYRALASVKDPHLKEALLAFLMKASETIHAQ